MWGLLHPTPQSDTRAGGCRAALAPAGPCPREASETREGEAGGQHVPSTRAGQRLLSQDGPEPPCTHKETARQVRQGPADLTAGLGHRQFSTESKTVPSALHAPPCGNSGRRFPEEHGFGADPTGRRRGEEEQASQAEAQGQPGPQMPEGFGQGGIAAPGLSLPDLCLGRVRTLKLNWSIMGYLDPSRGAAQPPWLEEAAPGNLLNQ